MWKWFKLLYDSSDEVKDRQNIKSLIKLFNLTQWQMYNFHKLFHIKLFNLDRLLLIQISIRAIAVMPKKLMHQLYLFNNKV